MDKRGIAIYTGIVVLGLAAMVGVVLFLRSQNAPASQNVELQTTAATSSAAGPQTKFQYPGTPLSKTKSAEPYKANAPSFVPSETTLRGPDNSVTYSK